MAARLFSLFGLEVSYISAVEGKLKNCSLDGMTINKYFQIFNWHVSCSNAGRSYRASSVRVLHINEVIVDTSNKMEYWILILLAALCVQKAKVK
jgi:hypothetical protein